MAKVKYDGKYLSFKCPGCEDWHCIPVQTTGPHEPNSHLWAFNGNVNQPTVQPSLLEKTGHHMAHHKPGAECWCTYNAEHPDRPSRANCHICHWVMTEGHLSFVSDSTHKLSGQNMIPLPEIG